MRCHAWNSFAGTSLGSRRPASSMAASRLRSRLASTPMCASMRSGRSSRASPGSCFSTIRRQCGLPMSPSSRGIGSRPIREGSRACPRSGGRDRLLLEHAVRDPGQGLRLPGGWSADRLGCRAARADRHDLSLARGDQDPDFEPGDRGGRGASRLPDRGIGVLRRLSPRDPRPRTGGGARLTAEASA